MGDGQGYSTASPRSLTLLSCETLGCFLLRIPNLRWAGTHPAAAGGDGLCGPSGLCCARVKGQCSVCPWLCFRSVGISAAPRVSGFIFGNCGGHSLRYREMLGLCFGQCGTKVSLTHIPLSQGMRAVPGSCPVPPRFAGIPGQQCWSRQGPAVCRQTDRQTRVCCAHLEHRQGNMESRCWIGTCWRSAAPASSRASAAGAGVRSSAGIGRAQGSPGWAECLLMWALQSTNPAPRHVTRQLRHARDTEVLPLLLPAPRATLG